jgi:soluble lytic murein transglycosylase-like protein
LPLGLRLGALFAFPAGMRFVLRTALALCLMLAPELQAHEAAREEAAQATGSLRGKLLPSWRMTTPAWLERAVCERGPELGEACTAVAATVAEEARAAGLDPVLVLAIIEVESGWDPGAVSNKDARGLMQLLVPTLAEEAELSPAEVDAHDPVVNVRAGIRFYAKMQRRFSDPELAMVAYNAGPGRLARYIVAEHGVPERFWAYPRAIRRAERRLRARLAEPAYTLAAAEGAPVVQ